MPEDSVAPDATRLLELIGSNAIQFRTNHWSLRYSVTSIGVKLRVSL